MALRRGEGADGLTDSPTRGNPGTCEEAEVPDGQTVPTKGNPWPCEEAKVPDEQTIPYGGEPHGPAKRQRCPTD